MNAADPQSMVLKNLQPDQTRVIALVAYDRLTFAQVAMQMGRSRQAVKDLFRRGLKHLRSNGFEWDGSRFVKREPVAA